MGSGLCARLWAELRRLWARGSGARNPFSAILAASNPSNPSNPLNLANGSAILAVRWRRSKTSHLLDCGLWALCETVGGVAQTVGSGLWRAKSFFSSGPKPLEPCQWFCHTGRLKPLKPFFLVAPRWFCLANGTLPMVLPYWPLETLQNLALARLWALGSVRWPLETLQNLALARLWALGSVRDCGRSCADCGLGALARQILFF